MPMQKQVGIEQRVATEPSIIFTVVAIAHSTQNLSSISSLHVLSSESGVSKANG